MKEIKFRVWEGKMHFLELIGNDFMWINEKPHSGKLMQFTGLLDKNGKEIYENDIIDFGGVRPIEIVWRNCGFESKLIPFENSNPIKLTKEGLEMFGEIIGNIYENPELLNNGEHEKE